MKCECRLRAEWSSNLERTTVDNFANDRLSIEQSKHGYRAGFDSHVLATELDLSCADVIVELGAGHGVVCLLLALQLESQSPDAEIIAIERHPLFLELLRRNLKRNSPGVKVSVVEADIRQLNPQLAHRADIVVCNPPFYRDGEGRVSPNAEKRAAHQELHGGLADFVKAAAFVLKPSRGLAKFVLPPARLQDFIDAVRQTDLGLESLRFVHDRAHSTAYLFEAVARRQSQADLKILDPLIVYEDGRHTSGALARLNP